MANWRREHARALVHITPDAAPALCGLERESLGATVWDAATAAPEICRECSQKLLAATDDAIAQTSKVLEARGRVLPEQYEQSYGLAKRALRELARLVPAGQHADRVVYRRACLARNDPKDADASLRLWRDEMRAIGLLPAT